MAMENTGQPPRDDAAPVRVFMCSRIGLQASPPGRRRRFGGRRV